MPSWPRVKTDDGQRPLTGRERSLHIKYTLLTAFGSEEPHSHTFNAKKHLICTKWGKAEISPVLNVQSSGGRPLL